MEEQTLVLIALLIAGFSYNSASGSPLHEPSNVTVTNKTSTRLLINWEDVQNSEIVGYRIRYRFNESCDQLVINISSCKTSSIFVCKNKTSIWLEDLGIYTNYWIQVVAFKNGSFSTNGSSSVFRTDEGAPTSPPVNVTAYNTSSTRIFVTWSRPPDNVIRGILRGYEISFTPAEADVSYNSSTMRRVLVCSCNTSVELTNLNVYELYNITVAAFTSGGIGNESDILQIWTDEEEPLEPPATVTAAPASETSVKVTWERVPKHKLRGNITSYNIQVINSSQSTVATIYACANKFTAVIKRLEMFVTYSVRVRAATGRWMGPWSANVTTNTRQTAPKVPLGVEATGINETSIQVSWNITSIHHRLNTPHEFQVFFFPLCQWNNGTINITAADRKETLVGLLVGVGYNITVRAINITAKDGTPVKTPYGTYSAPVNASTSEGVPQVPPPNVTAQAHTTTSIIVHWGKIPCDKSGGIITKYFIEVHNSSGMVHEKRVGGNETSYEVKGLEVYSKYSVKVRAANSGANSSFSGFYNTTTHQPAPQSVPMNVKAEAIGKSTIRVNWDNASDSRIAGYIIRYKIADSNTFSYKKVNKSVSYLKLEKLRPFTEYRIAVAARTTQEGNYSVLQSVKTLEGEPTKAPSGLNVQVLDSISARIYWGNVSKDHRNGVIKGYRVNYRRNGKTNYEQRNTVDGTYALVLTSLDKAATYEVKVLAFTSVGDGPEANKKFTTEDDIPSHPPVNVTAVDRVTPHSVNVSWEPVPLGKRHGVLRKYKVKYQKKKIGDVGVDEEPVQEKIVDANQTSLVLKGLEPYVSYQISVSASTAKGFGPPSPFISGETCHCEPSFTTSWRRYEPYANVSEDGEPGQIIPAVLQGMVDECCGKCGAYDKIRLDFKKNGKGEPALQNSSRELLENLDEKNDFTFPVYGFNEQDSYKGGYGYIPVIESAGVAFIVYPQESSNKNTMFDAMISCLTVLLLPMVTACVAGIIMWALERNNNPKDFPPAFLQGTWEGIWWAFVSMTTLGYGDRAPLSHKGRTFAIVWTLFGLVIIAITMAMVTSALTAVAVKGNYKLYGTKIAAEYNSPEYNLGTRRNAKFDKDKRYNNIDEVAQALINKEVEGILVDTYSAGLRGDLFNRPELLVSKVFDYKSAYGIVLSPSTTRFRTCFHRYMISHKAEVFAEVKKKVKPIETSNSTAPKDKTSGSILDSKSPQFRTALNYAIVSFGIVFLLSLTYELIRRIRKRHKVHQQVLFKTKLQAEMSSLVEGFLKRMQELKEKLGEKHRKQIIKFWRLQRKRSTTQNWLRISQVSPHPQEISVTDYNSD